jgi:ferredoxin
MDAIITIPKLKTHSLTKITGAVKNSYGFVIGQAKSVFHSKYPSPIKMAAFIAEIYGILKPDFALMDAVVSMAGNGPANGIPFESNAIFAAADCAAVDAIAASIYGYGNGEIPLLNFVSAAGNGVSDKNKIRVVNIGFSSAKPKPAKRSKADVFHKIPDSFFKIFSPLLSFYPEIDKNRCLRCGKCREVCNNNAIIRISSGEYKVIRSKCILCMCCTEACPNRSIELNSFLTKLMIKLFKKK